MNKDNYLVTGASGLVGFPLVNKLLDEFVISFDATIEARDNAEEE